MDTQITLAPPRVFHLLPFKIGPYYMLGLFGQNKTIQNDHSPSMTLSKVALKMIKSLKGKLPKDTWHHCNYGLNDDPRPSLSHPNTRLSTKCNGGTKLLKGLKI